MYWEKCAGENDKGSDRGLEVPFTLILLTWNIGCAPNNASKWQDSTQRLTLRLLMSCYLLALLGAYHFLHISRIRVKSLTLRLLMTYIYIYIYMEHLFLMFLDHTQRGSTVGRTPLDEWSARRRDLCLTTHDTHNRQISMPPVGFEPKISAGERPQAACL